MKSREKMLLIIFSTMLGAFAVVGILALSLRYYRQVASETQNLGRRVREMRAVLGQADVWRARSEWIKENLPVFGSREEASAALLQRTEETAGKAGLSLGSKVIVNKSGEPGSDPDASSAFDRVSVRLTLAGVDEQALFAWMHDLQVQGSFVGITRFQVNPSERDKKVDAAIEITRFYAEHSPGKLTQAQK